MVAHVLFANASSTGFHFVLVWSAALRVVIPVQSVSIFSGVTWKSAQIAIRFWLKGLLMMDLNRSFLKKLRWGFGWEFNIPVLLNKFFWKESKENAIDFTLPSKVFRETELFTKFYEAGKFTDVTVKTTHLEVDAHKIILAGIKNFCYQFLQKHLCKFILQLKVPTWRES